MWPAEVALSEIRHIYRASIAAEPDIKQLILWQQAKIKGIEDQLQGSKSMPNTPNTSTIHETNLEEELKDAKQRLKELEKMSRITSGSLYEQDRRVTRDALRDARDTREKDKFDRLWRVHVDRDERAVVDNKNKWRIFKRPDNLRPHKISIDDNSKRRIETLLSEMLGSDRHHYFNDIIATYQEKLNKGDWNVDDSRYSFSHNDKNIRKAWDETKNELNLEQHI